MHDKTIRFISNMLIATGGVSILVAILIQAMKEEFRQSALIGVFLGLLIGVFFEYRAFRKSNKDVR